MRVLHVIPSVSPAHGGPSQALVMMERALSRSRVAVTTITTDDDGAGQRLSIKAQPDTANGAARVYKRKLFELYKVAPGIVLWLWRHVRDFDVVHIHALFSFTSVTAGLIAGWHRVPYVIRPLGTLSDYGVTRRRPWLKRLSLAVIEARILRNATAVHFTSEAEWREAKQLGLEFRGIVIPLAVHAEESESKAAFVGGAWAGHRLVLYLSRLDPKKNVEGLLNAFAMIHEEQSDVTLIIAGDGPSGYVARLKQLARDLGVEGRVVWLGHVDGPQKAALFAEAQVFVLPSLSENFGIAAAEAMLAGLPSVLGSGVAIAQQAAESGACIVVTSEPEAISQALRYLLNDQASCKFMGERGREFAQKEFSTELMADRLVALYRRVADRTRESHSRS